MTSEPHSRRLELVPDNPQRLASLCGRLNEHLRLLEARLDLTIQSRGNVFTLIGPPDALTLGEGALRRLYAMTADDALLTPDLVHLVLTEVTSHHGAVADGATVAGGESSIEHVLRTPKLSVKPRTPQQNNYVQAILKHDINFGIGPAGTGKTYLAVACAVEALVSERVSRILLVRPAVEAGEKLGFLPGDLSQKVDPYLRPLYDALYEMLGFERVAKLIERQVIEVAPLAYMRGRTLNNSFIILDESQNTTTAQMKMFLTRIGFGSTAVITGDVTQIDLPKGTRSGLVQVTNVLRRVKGVSFTWFSAADVVRHPIVQRIVEAYDAYDKANVAALNAQEREWHNERDG
ncbi:MAG: PhoH family protein [Pseudomonadales bacterium]|jgi:phosphate starvation-inducible PhoH-like protein|nr:PhoH family protein [Pseudomonadales bacterium]